MTTKDVWVLPSMVHQNGATSQHCHFYIVDKMTPQTLIIHCSMP